MDDLKKRVKAEIIEALNLQDVGAEGLGDETALFGADGIGLDSIDALELVVMLDRCFGVKITNPQEGKQVLYSIDTITAFISSKAPIADGQAIRQE